MRERVEALDRSDELPSQMPKGNLQPPTLITPLQPSDVSSPKIPLTQIVRSEPSIETCQRTWHPRRYIPSHVEIAVRRVNTPTWRVLVSGFLLLFSLPSLTFISDCWSCLTASRRVSGIRRKTTIRRNDTADTFDFGTTLRDSAADTRIYGVNKASYTIPFETSSSNIHDLQIDILQHEKKRETNTNQSIRTHIHKKNIACFITTSGP